MNDLITRPSVTVALNLTTIPELQAFCQILAGTDMVPKGYKNKPDDILVAMLHGQEVGLPHLQALQSIAVVNGIPSIYGDAALALVRGSGKLEDFDEWLEVDGVRQEGPFPIMQYAKENRVITAVCLSKRVGMSRPRTTTFSIDDASRAGLWGKAGPWTTVPQRMLMWRARGWNLRDNFGDVLKGLAMYEESQDIEATVDERGVYTVPPDDSANHARLAQVQEQLKAKQQEQAAPPTVPMTDTQPNPPSDVSAGSGPVLWPDEKWFDVLSYLDEDLDRAKVKNRAKVSLGMKKDEKLGSLALEKREPFIQKLLALAKTEEVKIVL